MRDIDMSKAINRIASGTGNPGLSTELQDAIRNRVAFLFVRGDDGFVLKPVSGKYQAAMPNLETDQALSQTDTTYRAQSSQYGRHQCVWVGFSDGVGVQRDIPCDLAAGVGLTESFAFKT